ncbi:hypothetical protein M404DRAFT_34053 [Pisolithus tinctorius Marx 270]|uniref:Uncharacterized protein n=1 Tax=Pisolithus tinctorius Marx 270 TaxID=870435 RepID=A0A0C3NIT5_PISTI|nr:hypothetical protein M404DRAFT_34053 [Pisolithus tinctorius Marx 270]
MSFLPSSNHVLAADLWPSHISRIIESHVHVTDLLEWQHFPTSLSQFIQWGAVSQDHTVDKKSRSFLLVYKTILYNEPSSAVYPISVRIYGYLQHFSLGDVGNWEGDSSRAQYAVQTINLTGNDLDIAWKNQLDRLNLAATFASRALKIPLAQTQFRRQLYMQHKVFDKIPPPSLQQLSASSTDPLQVNPHMRDGPHMPTGPWKWNGPIEILDLQKDGTIIPIHEILLTSGDLVEVDAEFDLVIGRGRTGSKHLQVFLSCKQVLRLQPASDNESPMAHSTNTGSPTPVKRVRAFKATTDDPLPPTSPPSSTNPKKSLKHNNHHATVQAPKPH